ncbi:nitrate- and nitrite sensing domain-containing protein [Micromonospora profundi]|uniref:sensor histidine kinase n=1 Tax=Micromonospora profundi TaxID=1420889 RepID=UPI003646FEBF
MALPVMATLALTGVSAAGAASAGSQAEQARQSVALSATVGQFAAQLQRERTSAALVFAQKSSSAALQEYRRQMRLTDGLAAQFDRARRSVRLPQILQGSLSRVEIQLTSLGSLRQQVQTRPDAISSLVVFRYRALVADLIAYRQGLSQLGVDSGTGNDLRAGSALSQAIESLGLMQVAVVRSVGAGQLTAAAQQEIVSADVGFVEAMAAFRSLARARWQARVNAGLSGERVLQAERLQGLVARAAPGEPLRLGATAAGWAAAVGSRMDLLHGAEQELDAELLTSVTRQRDEQRRTIFTVSGAVLACLGLMVAAGWWVTRSMTGSLHGLREGATAVATERLPQMVAQLNRSDLDPTAVERLVAEAAEPIPVLGSDEVGEVAVAFNQVFWDAVRIAGEQAALRGTVEAFILALARRLQSRADRMMVSLDALERDEEDPDRLEKLFDLDHVATLIRRMVANLQVLAGGRAGRPRSEDLALPDLLRAAGGETDDYKRVDLGFVDGDVVVDREVAEELAHLLAELIDNAARYSPPDTPVVVEGGQDGDLLRIQVRDVGIGMRSAALHAARDRLAYPHRMDSAATEQMGLPVVGRIAQRLGIAVEIRSNHGEGTRVDLTVPPRHFKRAAAEDPEVAEAPSHAVVDERTRELPALSARLTAPVGGPPPPVWPAPVRTVASTPAPTAAPPPPLAIFEEVLQDPVHSWFATAGDASAVGGSAVAEQWRVAAERAIEASHQPASEVTRHGLPVRRPGRGVIPSIPTQARRTLRPLRDPETLRRRMNSVDQALGAAGRRTHHSLPEESAR